MRHLVFDLQLELFEALFLELLIGSEPRLFLELFEALLVLLMAFLKLLKARCLLLELLMIRGHSLPPGCLYESVGRRFCHVAAEVVCGIHIHRNTQDAGRVPASVDASDSEARIFETQKSPRTTKRAPSHS